MSELRRFAVEDGSDITNLVRGLLERAPFVREPDQLVERTLLDTFDWRVHRHGSTLELDRTSPARGGRGVTESWLVWRSRISGEVLGRFAVESLPRFVEDLPGPAPTGRLASVVEMRALLPLVGIRDERVTLRFLDPEGKTAARVLLDRAEVIWPEGATSGAMAPVVTLHPVRGYEGTAERVADLLAAQVVLRPVGDDLIDQALALAGHVPCDYSSRFEVHLEPDGTALAAVVAVVDALVGTMASNEAGVRADTDSEFLHDYRVAVRRARSVLGIARAVVAPGPLGDLRRGFKWLGDITTPTRDLDVYVLSFPQFEASLPAAIRGDLAPLRSFLVERQASAHQTLAAEMDSSRYVSFLDRLRTWLATPTPTPGEPAVDFAASRIWKAYRGLVRDARRISPGSPPEDLHDLRKDAKQLRYGLESFGSLFPAGELAPLVRDLKGVQDCLGEFQDCEVQKGSLREFGEGLAVSMGSDAAPTLLAMGYLIEQLDERELRARARFVRAFATFDRPLQRGRFRRLFSGSRER